MGAIYQTSDAGRAIDGSFVASTPVALVDSRQTDTRLVHLLSAGGAYHLVTEQP